MTAPGVAGPLDGIRVLELGTLIAGPFAGRLLGDMGADVIKMEPSRAPRPVAYLGPGEVDGHRVLLDRARAQQAVHHPRPRAARAAANCSGDWSPKSDIVVENFRPGTLEKWGPGVRRAQCRDQPRSSCSSACPATGRPARRPDTPATPRWPRRRAVCGTSTATPAAPPRLALSLGDTLAGMFGAQGVLAALLPPRASRARPGRRRRAHRSAVSRSRNPPCPTTTPPVWCEVRRAPGCEGIAPSNIYRSADDIVGGDRGQPGHRLPPGCARRWAARSWPPTTRFATHVARGRNQDELDEIIGAGPRASTR